MSDATTQTEDGFEERQKKDLEDNLKSKPTWLRFLFMLVFAVIGYLVGLIALVVVSLNFFIVLFSGEPNAKLKNAGATIADYLADIVRFLSYNTETKPFPFDEELPKQ